MRSHENINLSFGQVCQYLLGLFGCSCSRKVVYRNGHILQSLTESLVMLECKHRGWNEHSHLFSIGSCLESCPHRYFGLAKANVAAHQPIHWATAFHIVFQVLRRFQLVGRIFVEERSLQFVLHKRVGREGKALFVASFRIELYQVASNILDAFLRLFLESVPRSRAKNRKTWCSIATIGTTILAYFVERMDRNVHNIVVLIHQAYHFLIGFACRNTHQTSKLTNAKVYVDKEIAWFHLLQLLHCKCHLALSSLVGL